MQEPGPASPKTKARRPKRASDPVVRWLLIAIAAVVFLWFVGMISAMMFGLLTPPTAPRTEVERDLMSLSGTVKSGKADTKIYSQYISALIRGGQLAKAQQSITDALNTAKKDKSYLYARQADLLLKRQDYKGTVEAADKALSEANKEIDAFKEANKKANRKPNAGLVTPQSYKDAALDKAMALAALKKTADAIKAYDLYLKESPTDSDILVQRAALKANSGDKKGATKDYKEALKYIPDYQPALDGLKQIGAAQ